MKVFFVTTNESKLATAARVLNRHGIEVERVDLELVEIQASGVAQVVAAKVRAAFNQIKSPVIVNDGSVLIDALNGFPGPYVKHVNRQIGLEGYLRLMSHCTNDDERGCTVEDAAAFLDATRPGAAVFVRRNRGHLTTTVRGSRREGKMSLAPLFIPDGYDKTFAEMTDEEYEAYRQTPGNERMYEDLAQAILGTQTTFE